jgi:two-component system OmpR family response regulator
MGQFIPAILCIDDNLDTLELLKIILTQESYHVVTTQSAVDGFFKAHSGAFNIIILDINLSDGSGIQLCREIRKFDKQIPILFYTADAHTNRIEEAMKAGAQAYLIQPVESFVLIETVGRLLKQHKSEFGQSGIPVS